MTATERKLPVRISHAEIKAGIFLTLCLALFVAMLIFLGQYGHRWRNTLEIRVLFSRVSGLRTDAPVLYNGMEAGRVRRIRIVHVSESLLNSLPPLGKRDLESLPVAEDERENLRAIDDKDFDAQARKLILVKDRTMLMLSLEVLSENDTQRYRTGDEYRVLGTMMGDSYLEIKSGSGDIFTPAPNKVFLGVAGDMYSDLGRSLSQTKDILRSMADLVGGDAGKTTIRGQIQNFEQFTSRLENTLEPLGANLPATFDNVEKQVAHTQQILNDVEQKATAFEPKLNESAENVRKSILETQKSTQQSIQAARDKVAVYRKAALDAIKDGRKIVAEEKESIPAQVKKAHQFTDRFEPSVARLDNIFTRADDQMDKGIESTRTAIQGYVISGENLQQVLFRIKTWPWSFAHPPEPVDEASMGLAWKTDVIRREYAELRGELQRVRDEIAPVETSDKARMQHVRDLIGESDDFLNIGDSSAPPSKKRGSR